MTKEKMSGSSDLKQEIAKRLKAAREALGIKANAMAARLGIPPPTLSRYENGVSHIPDRVRADLDRIYGITPSYLVTGRDRDLHKDLADKLAQMDKSNRLKCSA